MMTTGDWERWEESWRAVGTTRAELDAMIGRTRRARRAIVLVRFLSVGVAVTALAVVAAALRHAGNPFEVALGLVVGIGIAAAWFADTVNQRRALDKVEALPSEYLATRRALCLRQLRFARLGWIVVALDLAFLFPWWIGGFRVHGFGFHVGQLLTIWGPVALMSAFVTWTFRVRSRALAELQKLETAEPQRFADKQRDFRGE
jgi:hypothetical protein